ncbi:hypothetical protein H0H81_005709 [Sphagnurus paluster]|uniref:Uncharacterized protein n=1 Tax=Sphagnurus paluster TaxID=117069 RepID=A0A9P7FU36_9AGAR|nr:hypothetical protein H0H81_005709 [Sphagnurus paluster]
MFSGHARGMCVLAARIVSENPDTTVTILTISDLLEKTRFEVDRQLEQGSPIIERIRRRVLSVLPKVPGNFVQIMGHFAEAYAAAYDTLVKEEPITCAETGTTFGAAPAPSVLVIDFFNLPHLKASRKLTGYSVPIIAWLPCSASLFIHVWGPERLGGYGDFGAKVDAEAALTGRPSADIAEEISFGTIFWPSENPDYLEEVIDALLENKIPFIFSHASPFAKIPAQLSERVNSSALGFLTSWAPQQIFWPFEADQPTGAAHVTENLKAGIELFEVRSGRGLGPIYRNGKTPKGTREAVGEEIRRVLDICKGEEGDQMRRNAERLKVEFRNVWEKGGSAILEVQKFLKDYA